MSQVKIKIFNTNTDQNEINQFLGQSEIDLVSQSIDGNAISIAYKEKEKIKLSKPTRGDLLFLSLILIAGGMLIILLSAFAYLKMGGAFIVLLGITGLITYIHDFKKFKRSSTTETLDQTTKGGR